MLQIHCKCWKIQQITKNTLAYLLNASNTLNINFWHPQLAIPTLMVQLSCSGRLGAPEICILCILAILHGCQCTFSHFNYCVVFASFLKEHVPNTLKVWENNEQQNHKYIEIPTKSVKHLRYLLLAPSASHSNPKG